MIGQGFYCIYCRLLLLIGINVESIEVSSKDIHAEVAVIHSIDINHRHYHKDEHLSQQMRSQVILIREEVNNSFHCIGSWRLSWMHSGSDQYHRLFEPFRSSSFRKKKSIDALFFLFFLITVIMGSDGQQMHVPLLRRVHQNLSMVVQFLICF